ncbi:PKD domain-containing protein [Mucilaginibacter sp. KACC 22063]|uniref:PKD domain-containing protein n=1 Tax=Mucilaginibacter sp. KACC 22063 TaxID=3025666 RepID=UPI002366D03D|nr:PKD domain-containing protein [Mucilaginibacter sp. KACC 22063]WDF54399.1 PKD domain-containing protein [Mucilaginibacter sp. KACC 22063]
MQDDYNNGRPVNTNRQNYLLLYIIVGILLLAGLIFLFKSSLFEKRTINAKILKDEIYLNEDLVYSDNTSGAKAWRWEFGNGDHSTTQNGTYRFKKPGAYIVRVTVDGQLQQQFPIDVKDTVATPVKDTLLTINGPTQGIVNEEVRLEAQGSARIYEWSFGETGRVDVKGPTALYTYHNPGTYFVKLNTDNTSHPVFHKILITNPDSTVNAIVTPGEGERKVVDDIRAHLQAIANGADFNSQYYYLVNRYFCGDEKVTVNLEANGEQKQTDFYSYCMRLTFGGGISIDEAQVTLKPKSSCSSLLTVKQHSTTAGPGIKRTK